MRSTSFPLAVIIAVGWNLSLLRLSCPVQGAWVSFVSICRNSNSRDFRHRYETSAASTRTTAIGRICLAATKNQHQLENSGNDEATKEASASATATATTATAIKAKTTTITKAATTGSSSRKSVSSRRAWFSQITRQVVAATAAAVTTTTAVTASPSLAAATTTTTATPAIVSTTHTCDPSVSVWINAKTGRTIYLLGTAHISTSSAMLAGDLVDDVRPDAVFVELDAKRVGMKPPVASSSIETKTATTNKRITVTAPRESIVNGPSLSSNVPSNEPGQKENASSKSTNNNGGGGGGGISVAIGSAAIGSAIKGMYGNLADQGFRPGEEFVIAIQHGQALGATIILGDRDVDVTLQRLSAALRQTDIRKLLSADSELEATMKELLPKASDSSTTTALSPDSPSFSSDLSIYVETMKAKENVRAIMNGLQKVAPEIYQAMVSERDEYMAHGLDVISSNPKQSDSQAQQFPVIVAVMGIAHTQGVEEYLQAHGWIPATQKQLKCATLV